MPTRIDAAKWLLDESIPTIKIGDNQVTPEKLDEELDYRVNALDINDNTQLLEDGSIISKGGPLIIQNIDGSIDILAVDTTSNTTTLSNDLIVGGGTTLNGDITIGQNAIINGTLLVKGLTTTIKSEEIKLADNIITLNSNATIPSENAGIEVERGIDRKLIIEWREADTSTHIPNYTVIDGDVLLGNDLTVQSNTKIDNNLVVVGISNLQGDVTLDSNILIKGAVETEDNNIILNKSGNSISQNGSGITIESTDSVNGSIIYDNSASSKFRVGNIGVEDVIATENDIQSFTNKTITDPSNVIASDIVVYDNTRSLNNELTQGFVQGAVDELETNLRTERTRATTAETLLQSNLDTEENNRINADNNLQSNLDTEEARAITAETLLQSNLDAEQLRAETVEGSLNSLNTETKVNLVSAVNELELNHNTYVSTNNTRSTTIEATAVIEETNRTNADNTLQANIDIEEARAISIEGLLSNLDTLEKGNLVGAVNDVNANIIDYRNTNDTRSANIEASVILETQQRTNEDTNITNALQVERARINDILSGSTADLNSFSEMVALVNSVDLQNDNIMANYVLANDQRSTTIEATIATETTNRINADIVLQNNINVVQADVDNNEAVARDADIVLQSNIDAVQSNLDTEALTRNTNDTQLQTNLTSEVNRAESVEGSLGDLDTEDKTNLVTAINELELNHNDYVTSNDARSTTIEATAVTETNNRISADNILQANLDIESNTRVTNDNTLQSNLDAEANTRLTNDNAIDVRIDNEIVRATDAETLLQSNLDTEASTRTANDNTLQANLDTEANTRTANDNTLQSNIDTESATRLINDNTLQSNLDTETNNRISADNTLQSNLDIESARIDAHDAELANQAAEDAILQANIDIEKGRVDSILAASSANLDSFKEIVDLINTVDTANDTAFGAYVTSNDQRSTAIETSVSTEIANRTSSDNILQTNIDDEATRAQGIESGLRTDLTSEISTRLSNDNTLQENIDVEASIRATNDNALSSRITTLENNNSGNASQVQANLDAESATRLANDNTLQTNINNEKTLRENEDTNLWVALNNESNTRTTNDNILQANIDTEHTKNSQQDVRLDNMRQVPTVAGHADERLANDGSTYYWEQDDGSGFAQGTKVEPYYYDAARGKYLSHHLYEVVFYKNGSNKRNTYMNNTPAISSNIIPYIFDFDACLVGYTLQTSSHETNVSSAISVKDAVTNDYLFHLPIVGANTKLTINTTMNIDFAKDDRTKLRINSRTLSNATAKMKFRKIITP